MSLYLQAVFETTLTRVLLPLPVLVIPPFAMQLLERYDQVTEIAQKQ